MVQPCYNIKSTRIILKQNVIGCVSIIKIFQLIFYLQGKSENTQVKNTYD